MLCLLSSFSFCALRALRAPSSAACRNRLVATRKARPTNDTRRTPPAEPALSRFRPLPPRALRSSSSPLLPSGFFHVRVLALPPHVASGHATHEAFGAATPAVRSAPWAVLERRVLSPIVPFNFLFVKKPNSHKQTNKNNGKAAWGLLQPTCALRAASSYCKQLRGFTLRWPFFCGFKGRPGPSHGPPNHQTQQQIPPFLNASGLGVVFLVIFECL